MTEYKLLSGSQIWADIEYSYGKAEGHQQWVAIEEYNNLEKRLDQMTKLVDKVIPHVQQIKWRVEYKESMNEILK